MSTNSSSASSASSAPMPGAYGSTAVLLSLKSKDIYRPWSENITFNLMKHHAKVYDCLILENNYPWFHRKVMVNGEPRRRSFMRSIGMLPETAAEAKGIADIDNED